MHQLGKSSKPNQAEFVAIDSPPPSWLHQNNSKTDVMEDPVVPEEVKCLRRLLVKSPPGPVKISYAVRKWLAWEGKLLAQIFEIWSRNKMKNHLSLEIVFHHPHPQGEENVIMNYIETNQPAKHHQLHHHSVPCIVGTGC